MPHPRGTIETELLGRALRLRAPLGFAGEFELRTGRPVEDLIDEYVASQKRPFSMDPALLVGAVAVLAEHGGNPLTQEELDSFVWADYPDLRRVVEDALVATGALQRGGGEGPSPGNPEGAATETPTGPPPATSDGAPSPSPGASGDG